MINIHDMTRHDMTEPGARPLIGRHLDVTAGSGTAGGGSGEEKNAVVERVSRKSPRASTAVVYNGVDNVVLVREVCLPPIFAFARGRA